MLSFATIQEAFNVPDIRKQSKKRLTKQENFQNPPPPPPQDYSYASDKLQSKNECYNNKEFNMGMPGCDDHISAPTYTYPISQETRNKADQAMQEFLRSQTINKPIKSNLDHLQSYMEDDMDMYLDVSQFKNNEEPPPPPPPDSAPIQPPPPPSDPVIEPIVSYQPDPSPPKNNLPDPANACSPNIVYINNGNKTNKISDIYLELFIFLFIGLIIITLCEMIVRIATN